MSRGTESIEVAVQYGRLVAGIVELRANRDALKVALELAREKLEIYRAGTDGVYQGGMEHVALLRIIDAAIAGSETP